VAAGDMPEDLRWVTRWGATRAAGPARYILRTGILGYGLAMFLVTTFFLPHSPLTAPYVLLRVLIWTAAGTVFGLSMWTFMEWRYSRVAKRTPDNAESGRER
jgi:hypothetical protein